MRLTLIRKLFPLLLVVCIAVACNLARLAKKGIDRTQPPTVIKSSDGRSQLTIPGGWVEDAALHAHAVLKASNRIEELYVIVLTDSKQDLADGLSIEAYTNMTRDHMMKNLGAPEATDPVPVTVGGYPARQYELHGTAQNVKASYINTVVETPANFHQIISWTLHSRFDQNQAVLRQVTESFKETGMQNDADQPPPPPPPAPRRTKAAGR